MHSRVEIAARPHTILIRKWGMTASDTMCPGCTVAEVVMNMAVIIIICHNFILILPFDGILLAGEI